MIRIAIYFNNKMQLSEEGHICRKRVDDALKILGTDYIDVLTLRLGTGPDSKGTTLEETAAGMKVSILCQRNM